MSGFRVAATSTAYEALGHATLHHTSILGTVLDQTGVLSPPALPCKLSYCIFIAQHRSMANPPSIVAGPSSQLHPKK